MRWLHSLLLIFLCSGASSAPPTAVDCENLAARSCSPDRVEDGTGFVDNRKDMWARTAEEILSTKEQFTIDLLNVLKANPNLYNRILVMTKNQDMSCATNPEQIRYNCMNNVAAAIQAHTMLMPGMKTFNQSPIFTVVDLELFMAFLKEPLILQLIKKYGKDEEAKIIKATQGQEQRIKTLFPKIQKLLAAAITTHLPDTKARQEILKKLNKMEWGGITCELPGQEQPLREKLFAPNATFAGKKFYVCPGLILQGNSDFQYAASIAHELSHSFDICRSYGSGNSIDEIFGGGSEKPAEPFKNLASCLRGKSSLAAVQLPGGDLCHDDQVNEAFADWMAAEALPNYIQNEYLTSKPPKLSQEQLIQGYGNVYRGFECNREGKVGAHPDTELRINAIYLTQPKIRAQLGCLTPHPKFRHCNNEILRGSQEDAPDTNSQGGRN